MLDWEERRQLVKVANLYYFEGLTQSQVASKIGVSRPIVSKLLQKAKDVGIVEIYIKDESAHTVELEQRMEDRFGLKDVIVVPTAGYSAERSKRAVARAGAYFLSKNLKEVKKLGISWGTTLAQLVEEYPFSKHEDIKIVPLEGGMGRQYVEIHANQLAYEMAKKFNGKCSYLYAPAIVETEELKERLMDMEDIKAVLEEGKQVDKALIGIGNPHENSTLKKIGYLQDEDIDHLRETGAVGDIGFRFFDENGNPIKDSLNDKVIGIPLEGLKEIKEVICVVEGTHKLESIRGALEGSYLDVLVIDEPTASRLLGIKGK
ncbi:sugar-binding transcriptional regulator [Pseudalkalibacillus caeni]|uniref:Sugar-binding transcriptional regulator n=1 Tax=Exobacillus caeni TaxID=2574798 RepID=A0A5R9F8S6_9BACL|nr:sugar-binding transcriptional regulator [Pseudalkalibacillus caeni]TLS38726.1 sugar-binding transcriptional regulator [Pseudalkalibacillus caeni]